MSDYKMKMAGNELIDNLHGAETGMIQYGKSEQKSIELEVELLRATVLWGGDSANSVMVREIQEKLFKARERAEEHKAKELKHRVQIYRLRRKLQRMQKEGV